MEGGGFYVEFAVGSTDGSSGRYSQYDSCINCMATSMAPENPMMIFISKSIRQGAKRI